MAEEEPKKQEEGGGAPEWMCTFADLMALLLCFFVLLLSFSTMDNMKYKQVAGSMKDAFGLQKELKVNVAPMRQRNLSQEFQKIPLVVQDMLQRNIQQEVEDGMVEVDHSAEAMTLRVKSEVAFDFGSAVIRPQFRKLLDELGEVVEKYDVHVEVGGNTDNVPVRKGGEFTSNYDLSARRAVAVVEYWRTEKNIPAEKLSAAGYADGMPLGSNATEEGRARNRRVEFKIRPLHNRFAFKGIIPDIIK
ncbi:MAG: flagellar motor protein MotB [Deltaproteobacteria bacterium]